MLCECKAGHECSQCRNHGKDAFHRKVLLVLFSDRLSTLIQTPLRIFIRCWRLSARLTMMDMIEIILGGDPFLNPALRFARAGGGALRREHAARQAAARRDVSGHVGGWRVWRTPRTSPYLGHSGASPESEGAAAEL